MLNRDDRGWFVRSRLRNSRRALVSKRGKFFAAIFAVLLWSLPLPAQFSANELAPPPEMIGKVAPRWNLRAWVNLPANSPILETAKLRGKVILLRFLNDSPQGAAGLRDLIKTYQAQGLAPVGIYAPSPTPTSVDPAEVSDLALALSFNFPIGIDSTWQTVNRYWMNRADVEGLAATFLIDRQGLVRYVQPDGRYEKNSRDRAARRNYENLEKIIQTLLAEPAPEAMEDAAAAAPTAATPGG